MESDNVMIFPELCQSEFDYDSIIGGTKVQTICGLKVKIDKIYRDITKTSVVGISGTFVIRGVKLRGVWDMYGNIIESRKILNLFTPKALTCSVDTLFKGTTSDMFRLVQVEEVEKK